jgi:hypothetical protein
MKPREVILLGLLGVAIIAGLVGFTLLPAPEGSTHTDQDQARALATEQACRVWSLVIDPASVVEVTGEISESAGWMLEDLMDRDFYDLYDYDTIHDALAGIGAAARGAGQVPLVETGVYDGFRAVAATAPTLNAQLAFRNGIDPGVLEAVSAMATDLGEQVRTATDACAA